MNKQLYQLYRCKDCNGLIQELYDETKHLLCPHCNIPNPHKLLRIEEIGDFHEEVFQEKT